MPRPRIQRPSIDGRPDNHHGGVSRFEGLIRPPVDRPMISNPAPIEAPKQGNLRNEAPMAWC